MLYDDQNIFARILRKEIPAKVVFEDPFVLAFYDVQPAAKIHVLVIPKGPFCSGVHFMASASHEELLGFWRAVPKIVEKLALRHTGLRFIINEGEHGGQEVPHFHLHLLGGEPIGPMRARP